MTRPEKSGLRKKKKKQIIRFEAFAMAKDEANAKIEAEKLAIENDEDVTDKFQKNVEQQEKIKKNKN